MSGASVFRTGITVLLSPKAEILLKTRRTLRAILKRPPSIRSSRQQFFKTTDYTDDTNKREQGGPTKENIGSGIP